jgi:hypothetical protein
VCCVYSSLPLPSHAKLSFLSQTGILNADIVSAAKNYNIPAMRKNDLNVAAPSRNDSPNAILRMEVELRDKNQPAKKRGKNKGKQFAMDLNVGSSSNVDLPMEKVKGVNSNSYRKKFVKLFKQAKNNATNINLPIH